MSWQAELASCNILAFRRAFSKTACIDSNMAHVAVAGLAEVLRDHEGTLGAAQAWCEQQNISSIHELKQKGDAAITRGPAFPKPRGRPKTRGSLTSTRGP